MHSSPWTNTGTQTLSDQLWEEDGTDATQPYLCRKRQTSIHSRRWGIVLAGGDGSRLQSLTRIVSGDDRPKQFCQLFGNGTLLRQARKRVARSIRPEQTVFALTRSHECYYRHELEDTSSPRLVQPYNRGTAPPILYSLLYIAQEDPDAIIAILPCDHYYSNENAFTIALNSAFETAETKRDFAVLLGARPTIPEVEFGWIEVGENIDNALFQVRGFHEKPSLQVAEYLLRKGALWNTFVMVGHIQTLLQMAWGTVPDLLDSLQTTMTGSLRDGEIRISDLQYAAIAPTDFSRRVLTFSPELLLTYRLDNLDWHDLGHPDRVVSLWLSKTSNIPVWVRHWRAGDTLEDLAAS